MKMWLDDIRPAPEGWVHVKSDFDARVYLAQGVVDIASLDHDLGRCDMCLSQTYASSFGQADDFCEHVGSGYSLVCWMEETGHWPKGKPNVHSANPVGRARMEMVINARYGGR